MVKIKASTLIELIVAISIIMIVLSIGIMTITNIQKYNNTKLKIKALIGINSIINKTKSEMEFSKLETSFDELIIKRYFIKSRYGDKLKIMVIEAFKNKKTLVLKKRELIYIDNEEN